MTKCLLKESERADVLLDPTTAAAHLHFASCPSCAQSSAQQSGLWLALDAWKVPEVSASFNRTLYEKIEAAIASPWYERWAVAIRQTFAQPSFAVAAVALFVVGGFVLDHPGGVVTPLWSAQVRSLHPGAVQVSSTEAEQVERTLEDLEMLHQFDAGSDEKENTQKSM